MQLHHQSVPHNKSIRSAAHQGQPRQLPRAAAIIQSRRPGAGVSWIPEDLSVNDPSEVASSRVTSSNGSSSSRSLADWGSFTVLRHLEESWASTEKNKLAQDHFRVEVDEKPQRTRNTDKATYYANMGDAIRALREDIPLLFEKDLNYEIYRSDILFKDPNNTFQGIKNYKTIFTSLRFSGRMFFKKLFVEVKRIWQPEESVIKMRWTVHGIPRILWESEGLFDGISTYKLDDNGRVYEHAVDNVLLRDSPMFATPPFGVGLNLERILGGSPQPTPVPGAWGCSAESSPMAQPAGNIASASNTSSALPTFSWWRLYFSLLASQFLVRLGEASRLLWREQEQQEQGQQEQEQQAQPQLQQHQYALGGPHT